VTHLGYQVKDADGQVVRRGTAHVLQNGHLSYEMMDDLPVGDYTIELDPVKVAVLANWPMSSHRFTAKRL